MQIEEPIIYFKSSEHMDEVADKSIQLIVTSPPYGKIKDYGNENQIGYSDSFTEYFFRLKNVWNECYRVLEPHCRMVINVGDQYLRTTDYGRYRVLSIASQIINDCLDIGFDFLGDIIWRKISTTNTTGGCSLMGSIYYPRNGLLTYDYEHILIFKKYKGKRKKVDLQIKELSKISLSEWKKWYIGHWTFPGIIQKEHIAMFPEELPYRIIRMFSFIGDQILDPFVGSGTTLKVAKSLLRKSIGYELNKAYQDTIKSKIEEAYMGYFKDYQYMLYQLYKKSQNEDFVIDFERQKQKGILFLKDDKNLCIIVDYILIENDLNDDLTSKLEENTFQNYLRESSDWNDFKHYIIVIKNKINTPNNKQLIIQAQNTLDYKKKVSLISFEDFTSEVFKIKDLFKI